MKLYHLSSRHILLNHFYYFPIKSWSFVIFLFPLIRRESSFLNLTDHRICLDDSKVDILNASWFYYALTKDEWITHAAISALDSHIRCQINDGTDTIVAGRIAVVDAAVVVHTERIGRIGRSRKRRYCPLTTAAIK